MIKIDFSEQDLKTIEHERFNHPIPLVQRRMEVLNHQPRDGCDHQHRLHQCIQRL